MHRGALPNDGRGRPSFRKWSHVPARAFAPPIMHQVSEALHALLYKAVVSTMYDFTFAPEMLKMEFSFNILHKL